jgi:hypothetical protein
MATRDAAPALPHAAVLAACGVASGALAWGVIVGLRHLDVRPVADGIGWVQLGPFTLAPGSMFGVVVGTYLAIRGRWSAAQLAGYVLASAGSYLIAYHVAFVALGMMGGMMGGGDSIAAAAAAGVVAGLCGSLLLGFFTLALCGLTARAMQPSIAVGAAAGALLPLLTWGLSDGGPGAGPLAFFALWQGAYAASLAPILAGRDDAEGSVLAAPPRAEES